MEKNPTKTTADSVTAFGKVPPRFEELENATLGVLMLENKAIYVAMSKLFPEIFYSDANQKIFRAIQMLYDANRSIDILTVAEQLRAMGWLEGIGGAYAVTKLTNDVTSSAHIEDWIKHLCEAYMRRETISLSVTLAIDAYDLTVDPFDTVNMGDAGFQKIQQQISQGQAKDISYFASKVLEQHANTKETGVLGIQTGLTPIDKIISGLVAPDLIIIAARPSQGKTALALTISYNTTIKNHIPCAWFSLEMDGTQLARRLASMDTGIDHEKIRKATTSTQEEVLFSASLEKIANCPLYIEDSTNVTIRDIRTRANILKHKHGIQYIVVDYIQLMNGIEMKGKSREQIVSDISRGLKLLAKELEMPVIALSQLSRKVEERLSRMPQLSDLRESGAIEQDADEVVFLMRPEFYRIEDPFFIGDREYDVRGLTIMDTAKNRHGEVKNSALFFKGNCMHFTDHPNDINSGFYHSPRSFSEPANDDQPF